MASKTPKIIYGGGALWSVSVEETENILTILKEMDIYEIDSAEFYGKSEENLGAVDAASRFVIHTKLSTSLGPNLTTEEVVLDHARESLRKLKTKSVDIYYLHAPDRRVPIERSLTAINTLHQEGAFKRFGISNFLSHEVEEIVRICKQRNYVQPSVYQGNYSAVARRPDTELFPILRKHNIAFYAYSPIAGGFLTKTRDILTGKGATGRWDPESNGGKIYNALYNKPAYLDALDAWGRIANEEGISKAELAFRWVASHSSLQGDFGDGIIFGAFKEDHMRETVGWIRKGPLSSDAARKIDEIWEIVSKDSPLDNFNNYVEEARDQKQK